jgi:bifunctional non-homologous end joining protein LigD
MPKTLESITLYFKEGSSDKFYVASITQEGSSYSVPVTWGRRGTSGQYGYKAQNVPLPDAQKAYAKVVKEKTAKGYHPEEGKEIKPHAGIPAEAKVATTLTDLDKAWEAKRKIEWKEDAPPAKVSSGLLPQLLNEIDESEVTKFLNDPLYIAQEKHDGKRRMLRVQSGIVEGINKKGQVVGYPAAFEDACIELVKANKLSGIVLDGEEVGETFHAFDLLSLDGVDLRSMSYIDRLLKLMDLTISMKSPIKVVATATSPADKAFLYEALKKNGNEGIVFKKATGVHQVGYHDDMRKFKFTATASVIVTKHNAKNSVAIAVMNGDKEVPVGNVTMIGHEKPVPGSIIEVRYLYWYKGGSLFQPRFLGVRDDVFSMDCTIAKLKCKAVVEEE